MAVFDSIVNEGDWIGEHFLTSDGKASFAAQVTARTKEWKDAEDSPLSRFTGARGALEKALVGIGQSDHPAQDEVDALHEEYLRILGFRGTGYAIGDDAHVTTVGVPGLSGAAPLAIVSARPADAVEDLRDKERAGLWEPFEGTDSKPSWSLPGRVSSLFAGDDAPRFVLVLAGRWALVAEAARWAEGRYLAVDLQLVAERNDAKNGGEILTALTILGAESLAPDAEGRIWWEQVLEESVKHTVGVSKDLREGVRRSIEILANEVVARRAAQGLEPLPQAEAQVLAKQSLRYIYRILFLLYAEASPELGVLPVGAPEYDAGYSLDRLRELVLQEITTEQAQHGTHLYASLDVLFRLVDRGHSPASSRSEDAVTDSLTFRSLRADLFLPRAVAYLDEVKLGNGALQQVLEHLLLSKEKSKRDRGFISYAELGINQLGAVYEGLMSYTGFFAEEDLFEVAKNGDSSKGSWVVPTTRAEGIAATDFVTIEDPETGEKKPVIHEQGTFVFRLAGRERQQSASFYTPEVLTRFTVSQALAELLDQDGKTTTAEEILSLTVCEPALGSGAFAIEATRQLAAEYLKRRQAELGERIAPEEYQRELQRVKAYIALHNVYGVDLNATAVELAEISLWLDTMVEGLEAPWFGLHLRRGNSLIGARSAVYTRDTINAKAWLTRPPTDIKLGERGSHQIWHFLLPGEGWGAAADAKEAKELSPDAVAALKTWRKTVKSKPTRKQLDDLVELSYRVDALWKMAARRLEIANEQARRPIPVWGREDDAPAGVVTREQIEESLADANSAYRRVRAVMDAWCALWFWPLTTDIKPPTLDEWIATCFALLGRAPEARRRSQLGRDTFATSDSWDELDEAEHTDLGLAGAGGADTLDAMRPWLAVARAVSSRQGFFHWEFEFRQIFAAGGFDLQVGNPPWVRPRSDVDALLAEGDPWWQLANKPSELERSERRQATLTLGGVRQLVLDGTADIACVAEYVGALSAYPELAGLQPDLYRCFMAQVWSHQSAKGASVLIHPETHFTDEKAGHLRALTYARLRRHWQFFNALFLFDEVHDQVTFGVHVYGASRSQVEFKNAAYLYHPDTVERSMDHDGSGSEPGLKDNDGRWDLRPHRSRVLTVTDATLESWHRVLETPDAPVKESRMLYTVNRLIGDVATKLASAPRIADLEMQWSRGWDESLHRKRGYFVKSWGTPANWSDVILQGPHLFVNVPAYKAPNPTMLHNQDWSSVDLETLPEEFVPTTSYKPAGQRATYDADYTRWVVAGTDHSARDFYRIAWRAMAANSNERTLIPALIPPGTGHINGVFASGGTDGISLTLALAGAGSLLGDFIVRSAPKSGIFAPVFGRVPRLSTDFPLWEETAIRVLRLNCLTAAYSEIWHDVLPWAPKWSPETPARTAGERRKLQVEIDALVALGLGVNADELCTVYRTQFAVLRKYDQENHYDANGRLVPNEILKLYKTKGENLTVEERTATHPGSGIDYTYEFPFIVLDREKDMREAYAKFEGEFGDDL
ncbi:DNA methyltransferase [Demequina lignilytica]|uniref:site-specific DNA-methyltransferase (adenine-specific) n=1 Tax=Demequina lignilytica TaxID=3051663 RepID=A0AB35MHE0_9MICO|nr:DNA methyltransferase [Demequina sp. SYSU T0a273]MDN4483206.1 class I SAM-dependent DNA methyltransferase [Demequina sp. SYSU T0a273]